MAFDNNQIKTKMQAALDALGREFSGLRSNRASPKMVEPITVAAYGGNMPLAQVASVAAPEARLITIQVWDMSNVKAVEKAIADSGLGLNPQTEGAVIRLRLPELSEERRKELVKVAGKYSETAKIAVRNARREGMDALQAAEKSGGMSQDEQRRASKELQNQTDQFVGKVDALLKQKEAEIIKT